MARIIPWKLPDVAGGSIGGYTPAPTPTPDTPDEQEYYDFTNVVITRYPIYGNKSNFAIVLSGVVVDDLSGVASVSIYAKSGYSNTSQADADSKDESTLTKAFTATQIIEPNSTYQILSNSLYYAVGEVGVIVYNSNGEILKNYKLTEDLDGE